MTGTDLLVLTSGLILFGLMLVAVYRFSRTSPYIEARSEAPRRDFPSGPVTYHSHLSGRRGLVFVSVAIALLLGGDLWVVASPWPPKASALFWVLPWLLFDWLIVREALLAPAVEVTIENDWVEFRSYLGRRRVKVSDVLKARADKTGRPEIVWKSGRSRVLHTGSDLQVLLAHLEHLNPSIKVSGLRGYAG